MTLPTAQALLEVVEATWPPAARWRAGPWLMRDGAGGGKRVSAATAAGPVREADIELAEREFARTRNTPLFMIRHGEDALDGWLAARGYEVIDPVTLLACPVEALTAEPVPPVSAFAIWPPLAMMRDIWARGGIGPARLAVMERARGPKTALLARAADRAAGAAFVAIHRDVAMIHAMEVLPELRRKGAALNMMRAAAHWAQDRGVRHFSLVVTDANRPANALYRARGMREVGKYHYRIRQEERTEAALD